MNSLFHKLKNMPAWARDLSLALVIFIATVAFAKWSAPDHTSGKTTTKVSAK